LSRRLPRRSSVRYHATRRPERSLWLQEALDGERDEPALVDELRAAVCIVGGGYTGLYTALRIKELEPAADVVLLEADICGGGPSGRNGGFMETWWVKFFALQALCGTDEALRLARLSSDAIGDIDALCRAHGIDAQIRREGWLWTASNRAQIGAWEPTVGALEALGVSAFERLSPERVFELSGSERHLAGVFERECATLHPARLARGLRRLAIERGVRIFEHSPHSRRLRAG